MNCKLCEQRGKPPHFLSERRCGFNSDGKFTSDNWNCVTLGQLRKIAEHLDIISRDEDEMSHTYIPVYEDVKRYIYLSWYKNRGRTEYAEVFELDDCGSITFTGELTLTLAEKVISEFEKRLEENSQ